MGERHPTEGEPSYRDPGTPDEESRVASNAVEGNGQAYAAESETGDVTRMPPLDPLDPGDHPEVDAWFDEREEAERLRRQRARAASFFRGGPYTRNRMLGR